MGCCWFGHLSGADCLHMAQLIPLHPRTPPHHLLSHLNPDWFYLSAFWYRLMQVVLEERPLSGGCSSSSGCLHVSMRSRCRTAVFRDLGLIASRAQRRRSRSSFTAPRAWSPATAAAPISPSSIIRTTIWDR